MSERTTKSDLHRRVDQIRFLYGADVDVNFNTPAGRSYGQITKRSNGDILSSRLKINELAEWLDGYCKALDKMGFLELLDAAKTLAELAIGLDRNAKMNAGSFTITGVHEDYLAAATIVNDCRERVREMKLT